MGTLFSIGLLGVFAYHCTYNGFVYKECPQNIKLLLKCFGVIGYLLYIATFIWSFWHFVWWKPWVIALITTHIVTPLTTPFFQKDMLGLSPALVILFSFFSIWGLL